LDDFSVNIFRTYRGILNLYTNLSIAIPPALEEKSLVNFGPLITVLPWLMFTH